jgi:REP element-mobilizing transposase RayT
MGVVIAHHLVWTPYGCWLPNDPRGSSSHEVLVAALARLGELHYGRNPIRPTREQLREFHERAQEVLSCPVMTFDEGDVSVLAESFGNTIRERRYTCYACAILPDHVHLLIRKHRGQAEDMFEAFQSASRAALVTADRWPAWHPVWGGPGWKVFQFTREDMYRTVPYIENNPGKHGLPPQKWDFVTRYDGWLPGGWHH